MRLPGPVRRVGTAVTQTRELVATSRAAGRAYGCSPLTAARIARRVRTRQGFTYPEALRVGVLDPAMSEAERAGYVGRHFMLSAQAPLNAGNEVPAIVGDKWVVYRYAQALGIPTPELYGILDVRGSGWGAGGRVIEDARDFGDWVATLPGDVIVKPAWGYMGRGVHLFTRRDGALVEHFRGPMSADEVWRMLRSDPEFDVWIVQERLRDHPALVAMAGDDALHSVRITTLVGRDGPPELLFSFLKLSVGGGVSDNFLGGSAGNGMCEVDLATGRLGPMLVAEPGRPGFRPHATSPATGAPIEGMRLPHWEEACALVLAAAPHFLPERSLGWDIALTPDGPVMVEPNPRWAAIPRPSAWGVLERIRAASVVTTP